jgi:Putative beta-lactamase-inhibitor-like, PepSY-like
MKKVSIFLLCSMIMIATQAQKVEASKVPAAVKESFQKNFAGMTPTWEMEKGNYEAGFKNKGESMSAVFDANGNLLEKEVAIKVSELPAPILSYVKQHYKGATVKEAAKITKADGTINYEAEVNKMDVVFDADGKFLKEEKD